ncbi:MAG: 4Fe-4S dicluster domain-containing protein [Armatimonadota bacterium]
MSIKCIEQMQLDGWVDGLIQGHRIYGVQAKANRFAFGPLAQASDLRLDYDVSLLPPKKYFQPLTETIVKFQRDSFYQSVIDTDPFILFGVHPYDVVAISQMDAIFSANGADIHYLTRRKNVTIVASDVQHASLNVFAACMGTATVSEGFDILLTKVGDQYVVDARTEKGEALMEGLSEAPDADDVMLARREQFWEDARRLLAKHDLHCRPEELPELLESSYEHPVWEKNAALCYSCGSCNLVCPTCYCFDVEDEVAWDLANGERTRKWDGCMLRGFAEVAGGHNFRKRREERYRHRFYRKGKYLWDRMGQIACIGCGRCTTACTAKIANPVELYNTLLEDR